MQVTFKAKRVAFSCFGMVRSLNNSTEPFVGIEAISIASSGVHIIALIETICHSKYLF